MIKVLVNGAKGRMGSESVRAIEADAELALVGTADRGDDLPTKISESGAQVVVDFTPAAVGYEMAELILNAGAHPVIGTSGFTESQVQKLQSIASKKGVGGLIAPNFAIGAVLLMKYAADAVKYFPHVEIIETHHDRKPDAPSGTAIRTAELIAANRDVPKTLVDEQELLKGARGARMQEIPIHSVRLPGHIAHEKVIFGGLGQSLTIAHDSINRESFMPGVVLACKRVVKEKELFFGLEHFLD